MNMLTKNDLNQVGEVVRKIIHEEVPPMIEKGILPLKEDVKQLKGDFRMLRKDVNALKIDLKKLKGDVSEIKEELYLITPVFDKRITRLEDRSHS